MKKLGFRIVLLIVLISILVSFTYMEKKDIISSSTVSKGLDTDPVIMLRKNDVIYNVMYPYNYKMDILIGDCFTNFSDNEVVELYITSNEKTANISYEITNLITGEQLKKSKINNKNIIVEGDHLTANLNIPELEKADYPYVLSITYSENNKRSITYYQNFYVEDNKVIDDINEQVTQLHNATFSKDKETINNLINGIGQDTTSDFTNVNNNSDIEHIIWNFGKDIVKMNEPIIRITNIDNKNKKYEVELKYTIAVRNNYEFEYWDFIEEYELNGGEKLNLKSFNRTGSIKKDFYYDNSNKQINIGTGTRNSIIQKEESANMRFVTFVKENQLWIFDGETGNIRKIFGFDKLDSDYIVDNYNYHNIKINSIDDDGNISYMVYGYMNTGNYKGDNGIALYEFNYFLGNNKSIGFVNLPYEFDRIDYYINQYSYIPQNSNSMYIILDGSLLQIDFTKGSINNLSSDMPYNKESIITTEDKKAIFYSENNSSKFSNQLNGIIINNDLPEKISICDDKLYVNLIGNYKNNVVVGYYDICDTIEKLNGYITYLYNKIQVLNSEGKVINNYTPEQNYYYSEVEISKSGIRLTKVKKQKNVSINPRYSKIELVKMDNQEITLNNESNVNNYLIDRIESPYGYDYTIIRSDNLEIIDKTKSEYTVKNIDEGKGIVYRPNSIKEGYAVINEGRTKGIFDNIEQALNEKELYDDNTYVIKLGSSNQIMYCSNNIRQNIIQGIPVIPQRPELPRGCEVTSLTMLLNYYITNKVDKMQLADEIKKDITEYNVIDGMINFGDPHTGFVGDIANVSNKGYSVYNEPIEHLAKQYVPDNVLNITGSNFEDVLYYVGLGHPVWVSTPNIYTAVPHSSTQQWITPKGIKEISYTSHSVLIVGYDSKYVYFNDPSKNMLRKKLISDFENGWNSMGKQAILIY
ncbi:hypothetical protein SH1V18_30530 [Vallitalea longa]|uniref:Peptidase C39-like domain-containing protein n=1 Tax=Vallitalea longa TaxID=2936439 RepID=A0A9W6DGL4_9FIRM|nr:C39 family peptidase [Vallitalea longa]GKX30573.1 hypothetical protein SH1V18_30530 [Vallitalea longa]